MRKILSTALALGMLLSLVLVHTTAVKAAAPAEIPAGKVFAGYYTDDTYHTPSATETAYPKFVDENVLTVKYQLIAGANENDASTKIRVVTTVDSTQYQAIGFHVWVNGVQADTNGDEFRTRSVFSRITGTDGLGDLSYEPTVFSPESKYFCAYNFTLNQASFGKTLTFQPYWITPDGTEVTGNTGIGGASENGKRDIVVNQSESFNERLIGTAAELTAFAQESQTKNFENWKIRLTADIDLNPGCVASTSGMSGTPTQWTSIGSTSKYFKGVFDGQGHTISGLYQNTASDKTTSLYLGLFAATSGVSTVKNFRLENSYIRSYGQRIGSIAGNGDGNFEDIYSNAIIITAGGYATAIGGMVGYFDGSTNVRYSGLHYDGTLTGSGYYVGGILGQAANDTGITLSIENCRNSGTVFSSDVGTGSMVGIAETAKASTTVNITGCWNEGSVSATNGVQGIFVGRTRGSGAPTVNISDCLNTFVNALNPVGSQVTGTVTTLRILSSRSSDVKIWPTSGDPTSVVPSALQGTAATGVLTSYGFDFDDVWATRANDLPIPAFFAEPVIDIWTAAGTEADPYVLSTADDLREFAEKSQADNFEGKYIKLGADIDLNPGCVASTTGMSGSPRQWTSIGSTSNYFKGVFDGDGHTISGLYLNSTTHTGNLYLGLFAATSGVSTVKNFRLENSYIYTKGARNGSIAGNGDGNFRDIYSNAIIVTEGGNASAIGGMIGYFDGSANVTYSGLQFDGIVTGSGYHVGGILGRASNGAGNTLTIENCKMSGSVSSSDTIAGGILGLLDTTASSVTVNITGCWTSGNVDAPSARGTIIGTTRNGAPVINITDCLCSYATTYNLIGSENILANYRRVLFVRADYAKVHDNAGVKSDEIALADVKGAAAEATLTAYGFDFDTTWSVRDGDFPVPYFFR